MAGAPAVSMVTPSSSLSSGDDSGSTKEPSAKALKRVPVVSEDAAKDAARLLDLLTVCKHAASVLSDLKDKHSSKLPNTAVAELELVANALHRVHDEGRHQTVRVSPLTYLLKSYDKRKAEERRQDKPLGRTRDSPALKSLKKFSKERKDPGASKREVLKPLDNVKTPTGPASSPVAKRARRSSRKSTFPNDSDGDEAPQFTGLPPKGENVWTRATLIKAIYELEGTRHKNAFITSVLASGRTDYQGVSSIYRMYNRWKESGEMPGGRGRPAFLSVPEAQQAAETAIRDRVGKSNTFQLKDMKKAFAEKKKADAERDGFC